MLENTDHPRARFEDPMRFLPRVLTKLYTLWLCPVRPNLPKAQANRVGRDRTMLDPRQGPRAMKVTWDTTVEPPNQLTPMEDPLQLLPRILTKLNSIWVG